MSEEELTRLVGDAGTVRVAFEQTPIGLAYLHGADLVFGATNAAYRAMWDRGPLVGRAMREALAELDDQYLFEVAENVLATGEPVQAREWRVPVQIGDRLEEKFFDFQIQPRRDAAGSIAGVLIQVVDVTAQVRVRQAAEAAVLDAERRYRETREVLVQLQDALLPADVPLVPGIDVAACYLLAEDDTAAGGDWFDAVPRPDGRLALVVGDVVGHGVSATAAMGQLRAVLRQRLLAGAPITEALDGLDVFARTVESARASTVCVADLDPTTGELTYCTAGHPPPLVVGADRQTRFLEGSGAGPLVTGSSYDVARAVLDPDETLVLYTDGLVERPGRTAPQGMVELAHVAGGAHRTGPRASGDRQRATERMSQTTLELLTRVTGHTDDITLLAAQRVPEITPLEMRVPAHPEAVQAAREALTDWLLAHEVRAIDKIAIEHAVGEVVSNVVEHAYAGGVPGQVHLTAGVDRTGELTAEVRDDGTWSDEQSDEARAGRGGRGLAMARGLVDALSLSQGAERDGRDGTVVTLRHRLTRPAVLFTAAPSGPQPAPATNDPVPFSLEVDEPAGVVRVQGPLDLLTAEQLRTILLRAGRGGTRPVRVDLSGVTLLASAAVQVLHELRDGLVIVAPRGTPAQHVMDLVQLPHTTEVP